MIDQQRVRGLLDHVEVLALLGGEVRVERERGHADDAVHRGPNLVAHVRQEFTLGAAGGLRVHLRALQFTFGALAVRDVDHGSFDDGR